MPKAMVKCGGKGEKECQWAFDRGSGSGPGSYRSLEMPPDDFEDWYDLVKALAQHMVDRHGLAEVSRCVAAAEHACRHMCSTQHTQHTPHHTTQTHAHASRPRLISLEFPAPVITDVACAAGTGRFGTKCKSQPRDSSYAKLLCGMLPCVSEQSDKGATCQVGHGLPAPVLGAVQRLGQGCAPATVSPSAMAMIITRLRSRLRWLWPLAVGMQPSNPSTAA